MQRQLQEAEERARVLQDHINALPPRQQPPPQYYQQPRPGQYAPPQHPPQPQPAAAAGGAKEEGFKVPSWVLQWLSMLICTAVYFVVGAAV